MKRVLIIEDNEDNLYMLQFILEKNEIAVISARTGLSGFELAQQEKPDLILMDIQLPDVNGLEVTRMIRHDEEIGAIPILAVSSYAMTGDRQKALQAGCSGYIEKPIDPEKIMETINQFLK